MKILSLLLLTIFIGTSCSSQKTADMTSTQIEYSAMSRGLYKKIMVQNKTVSIINGKNTEAVESKISDAIANLKVVQNQKTYETKGFDNGNPPKEIEKLVNLLLDFTKE